MSTVLIVLWVIFAIVGVAGSVLPVLPWPVLVYISLLLLQFTEHSPFTRTFLIVLWVINVWVMLLDYIVPIWWTKKFWWTKRWTRWSTIWLIVAVVILPILWITIWPFWLLGLIWWPFLWAYLWEKLWWKEHKHALRSAYWSFIGFLSGMFLKLVISLVMAWYFFIKLVEIYFK